MRRWLALCALLSWLATSPCAATRTAPPGPQIARVTIDETPVSSSGSGDFDAVMMSRMLHVRSSAFRACYERGIRAGTTTGRGDLTVEATILPTGSVDDIHVTGSVADATVVDCVRRVVSGFRFNPGPEGGTVTYAYGLHFETIAPPPPPSARY